MKLIYVTQRVDMVENYGERRDALDQQWTVFFERLGYLLFPVPNQITSLNNYLEKIPPQGILLTGGNDLVSIPEGIRISFERDKLETTLLDYAAKNAIPVFGVCRGAQLINTYFGGKISRVDNHVGVRHSINLTNSESLITLEKNSFHNYGIRKEDIAAGLSPLALGRDGSVEAFRHVSLPWVAVMWHPERESPFHSEDIDLFRRVFNGGEIK